MNIEVGENYLITCDNWFYNPVGEQCRAVWGEVKAILNDSEALGIKTNRGSTNWFVQIGDTIVAGCQIHFAVKCEREPPLTVKHSEYDKDSSKVISYSLPSSVHIAS